MVVLIVVMACLGLATWLVSPVGTLYASPEDQQKGEEGSAPGSVSNTESGTLAGMESLSDWVEDRPVTKEFLRTLEERWKALQKKEQELERREEALQMLQRDVEAKLRQLETERAKIESSLDELTRRVDQARTEELAKAVSIFKAMEAEAAAKVLIQMDLDSSASILKEMSRQTVGGIWNEMVELAGTDSEKLEKLAQLGEYIYDPQPTPTP